MKMFEEKNKEIYESNTKKQKKIIEHQKIKKK